MQGNSNDTGNWQHARGEFVYRIEQAEQKSCEQDEHLEATDRRVSELETINRIRDDRTARISWIFGVLGGVLGSVITALILIKVIGVKP